MKKENFLLYKNRSNYSKFIQLRLDKPINNKVEIQSKKQETKKSTAKCQSLLQFLELS